MPLPQAAVTLVGDREDVGGQLPQVAPAVPLHGGALIQASDGLVGVHGGDDGADVGLQAHGVGRQRDTRLHMAPRGWLLDKAFLPPPTPGQRRKSLDAAQCWSTLGTGLLPPLPEVLPEL